MEILSVSLKNFKSHSDRSFVFQPGTNAICGENGAGKTSILEAIAWVLFDYKGDYKVEDLVRNGANSAQARVCFVSSRDQRTYEVQRCTRAGYTLFDPQLGERLGYSRIKEEVLPWLRENLGVPVGTDLAKLFSNTIGVPQGTFTVDFLQTAEKRKPIFDAILKVEEYRQVNQQMLSLEKYAKAETERLDREIKLYDESLQEWEPLSQQRHAIAREISQIEIDLTHWRQRLDQLQNEQEGYSAIAAQVQQLTSQLENLSTRIQSGSLNLERLNADLAIAEKAVEICTTHRENYHTVLQAEAMLKQLERDRATQQDLLQKRQALMETSGAYQTQLATVQQQIERRSQVETELKRLEPLIGQQTDLETQQQNINQQLQDCQSWRQTIARDERRLTQLETHQKQLSNEIERLEALGAIVHQIPYLEQQLQRYQQQLSRIEAATQFESDLRQIITQAQTRESIHNRHIKNATATLKELQQATPLWSTQIEEVLVALGNGSTSQEQLMADLQSILDDLSEQILAERLKQLQQETQAQLDTARSQQAQYFTLEVKFDDEEKLATEVEEVRSQLAQAQTQLASEPDLKQQLAYLTGQLQTLENPRERTRILQRDLNQQANLESQQQKLETLTANIGGAIADLDAQLQAFAHLSAQLYQQQELRERHRKDYQIYLEHQQSANSYKGRKQQLEEAANDLQLLQQQEAELATQKATLAKTYDPEKVADVQKNYQEAKTQQITLTAMLPEKLKRLEEYDERLSRLQVIQQKRTQAQADQKRKQKTERFIKFARKAYKEAGPRITERYVHNISREADKLFRELMNRPNVALEWTRDYEIVIQEGAHSRRFINLSGGEQMCAALAVRLALLKVLADINIAFFDEPTTNMDRPRRESLADAIANIKTFRQLFVISHDDTFEKVTENIIVVERDA
ncbi:AAA family ATPase [Myxacorys almedinensis]|uniref:Nuclease SbcCD subunit C n=1 Tax=Myxacorys almedinensis A TaxID=2690445 RepID=A0A8J7YW47_9CYAN|nr:SMC family ATPase [Myxacorys almedinensis]NDJ15762.1 AAA family ATPase [Myxacorys almedinensis A]